ncbi:MAG: SMC-Scp complex subunit ScpB [Candidatus Marinimicrobia bacterium]|nr:SMC-Scp complex subunit ScpB [Candidatus Neomarinimicrobiota bacterium]
MVKKNSLHKEELRIVEALLFSSSEPLTQKRIDLCFDNNAPLLSEVIPELIEGYNGETHSFTIEKVAGGYRLITKSKYEPWVKRLHNRAGKTKLSPAALEVLAVIAYKAPITRVEIESIRGVNSGGVIKTLIEKNLLRIKGRAKGPGRALLYTVTDTFLISFGLDQLSDLPKLREISDLEKELLP